MGHSQAALLLLLACTRLRTSSTLVLLPLVTILQIHASIDSRHSQTCVAHRTRSSSFSLGQLKVPEPRRRALPPVSCADVALRSAPRFSLGFVLSACSRQRRGARYTPRRGQLEAAIASITCRTIGLGRVSRGAALCGSQVASRPYTSKLS